MDSIFVKNFLNWFNLKPKLDKTNHQPPFVSEGQIWWCHLGENIGSEISGKGISYTRPAIIYKKLSHYTYLVIPTSTKIKIGSWFVPVKYKNVSSVACLHQIRTIDYRRIQNQIAFLSENDFILITKALQKLYFDKIMNPSKEGDAGNPE